MAKIHHDDVMVTVFNDGRISEPERKREHYIHVEITGVFGCIDGIFNAGQRGWDGKGDICYKGKGKNKMTYTGRDIGNFEFDGRIVENGMFKGSRCLPTERSSGDCKLCPITGENRTIIG